MVALDIEETIVQLQTTITKRSAITVKDLDTSVRIVENRVMPMVTIKQGKRFAMSAISPVILPEIVEAIMTTKEQQNREGISKDP